MSKNHAAVVRPKIECLSDNVRIYDMSDYELIMIILTIGLVVIHVIDLQNKK